MADFECLLETAERVVKNSYAPYSKVRVAAVLEADDGSLFVGVNVENASYGLTICAERVAIFSAITAGKRKFRRILIYSPDVVPFPCGACRQVMAEFFNGNEEVIVVGPSKKILRLVFSELLPYLFKLGAREPSR